MGARRNRVRGSKRQVWNGSRKKTKSAMTKSSLTKNKRGLIVSKKKSRNMKRRMNAKGSWVHCVMRARKELGITGFCAIRKGTPLYTRARELYDQANGN